MILYLKVDVGISSQNLKQSYDSVLAREELQVSFLEDVTPGWTPAESRIIT